MKKNILILGLIILVSSCGLGSKASKKDATADTEATVSTTEEVVEEVPNGGQNGLLMAEGHVRDFTEEGCGFLIQILEGQDSITLEPLTIPEEHQVEGKHVKLTYRMSRRQSKCKSAAPIVIDKIIG